MTDPLTVLGSVAASVQLADAAGKAAAELYDFFRAVQAAGQDVQRHTSIIQDVMATIPVASSYITDRYASNNTAPNDGISSLSDSLSNLYDELRSTQALVPKISDMELWVKVKWALRKKSFGDQLRLVEYRKDNVMVALQVVSLQLGNQLQRSMQGLNVTTSETHLNATAIQGLVSTIKSDVARNQGVNAALLGQIHDSIPIENEKLQRQVQSLVSGNSRGLAKRFDSQQKQITDFKDVSLAEAAKMDGKLDFLTSFITSSMMPAVSTSSTFSVENFTRESIATIARNECKSVFRDVLEQLNISQSQRENLGKQLRGVADGASTELFRENVTNRNEGASFINNTNFDERRLTSGNGSYFSQPQRRKERISTYEVRRPWLGTIRINTYCIGKRNKATKKWEQSVEVSITIWSTLPVLRNRCIDIIFTTERSSSGHSQLFPSIATYPIIPWGSSVFQYIINGDVESLRSAFIEGRASPNDQGENGWTLLHRAVQCHQWETCKMLLECGANNNIRTRSHQETVFDMFLEDSWDALTGESGAIFGYQDAFEMFSLLTPTESGLEDITWEPYLSGRQATVNRDYFKQWVSFLNRNEISTWSIGPPDWRYYLQKAQYGHEAEYYLLCGISPNQKSDGEWRLPLFAAIEGLWSATTRKATLREYALSNVLALLEAGADIHAIIWVDDAVLRQYPSFGNYDLLTPSLWAEIAGVVEDWELALRRAGYDPDEVFAEDVRLEEEALRYHGGTTTAIETERNTVSESTLRFRRSRVREVD